MITTIKAHYFPYFDYSWLLGHSFEWTIIMATFFPVIGTIITFVIYSAKRTKVWYRYFSFFSYSFIFMTCATLLIMGYWSKRINYSVSDSNTADRFALLASILEGRYECCLCHDDRVLVTEIPSGRNNNHQVQILGQEIQQHEHKRRAVLIRLDDAVELTKKLKLSSPLNK